MKSKVLRNIIISVAILLASALVSNACPAWSRGATLSQTLEQSHLRVEPTGVECRTAGVGQYPTTVGAVPSAAPSKHARLLYVAGSSGQIGLRLYEEPFNAGAEREFNA